MKHHNFVDITIINLAARVLLLFLGKVGNSGT